MQKILGALFILSLLATAITSSALQSFVPTINYRGGPLAPKMDAVVFLTTPRTPDPRGTGEEFTKTCVGFYVAPSFIMTAAHCVEPPIAERPTFLTRPDLESELTLVYLDLGHDLAVLKTTEIARTFLRFESASLSVADPIWVYSFGGPELERLFVSTGHVANPSFGDRNQILIDRIFMRGQSGSPVISERGRVISVATASSRTVGYAASVIAMAKAYDQTR